MRKTKGSKGSKGSKGARGIPGPPGPAGRDGERGLTGETGGRGERGITGPIGRVKNLGDVSSQLKMLDGSIDHIHREMSTHITRMTQLQRQLDILRDTVRHLLTQTAKK